MKAKGKLPDVTLVFKDNQQVKVHKVVLGQNKMDNICKFHMFGYCKLQKECEKKHFEEECKEGSHCKAIKTCEMRHPKMCKIMVMEGLCHYADKCAYKHQIYLNSGGLPNITVQDDVNTLKIEVDNLKSTIKLLIKSRDEEKILKRSIKDLKDEVKQLSASNEYIKEQIALIEEDSDT